MTVVICRYRYSFWMVGCTPFFYDAEQTTPGILWFTGIFPESHLMDLGGPTC